MREEEEEMAERLRDVKPGAGRVKRKTGILHQPGRRVCLRFGCVVKDGGSREHELVAGYFGREG